MKFIKRYGLEITFVGLILICLYIYFVVYMTPSRHAWYIEMHKQLKILYHMTLHMIVH